MKTIIIAQNILQSFGDHQTIFQRSTITVHPARTSEEILNLHGIHKADIIITDADLPNMGGARLCSVIRSDVRLKNVAILLVCDGTEASFAQCRDAQANIVLPKPLDFSQLTWKVSELLLAPQRESLRTLLHVSVKGRESSPFLGVTHNISLSGMLLETDRVLKAGERLSCDFQLGHIKITTDIEITRQIRLKTGRFQYGARFLNLDMKYVILIEQFIKGRVKH